MLAISLAIHLGTLFRRSFQVLKNGTKIVYEVSKIKQKHKKTFVSLFYSRKLKPLRIVKHLKY